MADALDAGMNAGGESSHNWNVGLSATGGAAVAAAAGNIQGVINTIMRAAQNPILAGVAGGKYIPGLMDKLGSSIAGLGIKLKNANIENFGIALTKWHPAVGAAIGVVSSLASNWYAGMEQMRASTKEFLGSSSQAFDPLQYRRMFRRMDVNFDKEVVDQTKRFILQLNKQQKELSQSQREALGEKEVPMAMFLGIDLNEVTKNAYKEWGMSAKETAELVNTLGFNMRDTNLTVDDSLPLIMRMYSNLRLTGGSIDEVTKFLANFNEELGSAGDKTGKYSLTLDDLAEKATALTGMRTGFDEEGFKKRTRFGIGMQQLVGGFAPNVRRDLDKFAKDRYGVDKFANIPKDQLSAAIMNMPVDLMNSAFNQMVATNQFVDRRTGAYTKPMDLAAGALGKMWGMPSDAVFKGMLETGGGEAGKYGINAPDLNKKVEDIQYEGAKDSMVSGFVARYKKAFGMMGTFIADIGGADRKSAIIQDKLNGIAPKPYDPTNYIEAAAAAGGVSRTVGNILQVQIELKGDAGQIFQQVNPSKLYPNQ
jgi:hypothetical protein